MDRPTSPYAGMVRALADAKPGGRVLLTRLAAAGSGREVLVVYIASIGTAQDDATRLIVGDVAALDTTIAIVNAAALEAIAA